MDDQATPNLPSRDFSTTAVFYAALGFVEEFRDSHWMILRRESLVLEFFPYPDLLPERSSFGCCLRLSAIDDFYSCCLAAGVKESTRGFPRLHRPVREESGLRIGALLDPDGSLLRLIGR